MKRAKATLAAAGLCLLPVFVCVVIGRAVGNKVLEGFGWFLVVVYEIVFVLGFIGGCWYWALKLLEKVWSGK